MSKPSWYDLAASLVGLVTDIHLDSYQHREGHEQRDWRKCPQCDHLINFYTHDTIDLSELMIYLRLEGVADNGLHQ